MAVEISTLGDTESWRLCISSVVLKNLTPQVHCGRISEGHTSRADAIRVKKRMCVVEYKKRLGWEMGESDESSSYWRH